MHIANKVTLGEHNMDLAEDPLGQSFVKYIRDGVIPMRGGKLCVNDRTVLVEGKPHTLSKFTYFHCFSYEKSNKMIGHMPWLYQ